MDANKQSCLTKGTLLLAWQSVAQVYSKAVADLSRQIVVLPEKDCDKLSSAAASARKRALEAQASLESHILEHGCAGNDGAEE